MSLITKIQYRNYEPGEFVNKKERTYEDTIQLIENFPWQQQREHLPIDPTGPSVTFESDLSGYLKLAPYYEGKFMLYYLDSNGHFYTKSCTDLHQSFAFIQAFFEDRFNTEGFQLEKYWTRGKTKHFKDIDFHYTPDKTGILITIILVAVLCLFLLVISSGLLINTPMPRPQIYVVPPILFLLILLIVGRLILLINYYRVARDKELILSKGNDIFYYGSAGNIQQFDKKDIKEITVYGSGSRRLAIDGFIRIEMQSGVYIYIPYMVLHKNFLLNKLANCRQWEKFSFFPFIPRRV